MFQLDILSLIPHSLKQQVLDTLVDLVSSQAKRLVGDEVATKIKKLRSDATFTQKLEAGLQRAVGRFLKEYETEDEDLVNAISADKGFFRNPEVQSALLTMLKNPGTYLVEERDAVVQSFASVLVSLKNRERVDRAVTYLLKCLTEELWHLPEFQPIYSLQFQRMTAEATRQQVELQKEQLQALTGLSAGVREALLQLTEAIAKRRLLSAGDVDALPPPSSKPKVYHNLPQPDYGRFVGREKEIAEVVRILRPYPRSQMHLVTIDGIGGIGKSTLALEVAHRYLNNYDRIPPEERFEAIIWTSAKQTVLTAEGIVQRRQALHTLDGIYVTMAVTLRREDITRARADEQPEVVRNALTQQRTLLIVDNLETVDDETVMEFLHELPAPTKAIVTTRHRLDVAFPVRLVGMPWEDAQGLMAQECKEKEVALSDDEARRLYERTGGVPLAIVWSVAQMGLGYSAETVLLRLGQPASDIARFCFEGAIELIKGKPAHKLLMALSLFATDASREALGHVANLPVLDRDEGLVTLEKLSLVNKRSNRFQALPLTLVYSQAELAREVELDDLFRNRWIEFFLNMLVTESHDRPAEVERAKPEIGNIMGAIDWCWHTDRLQEFKTLVDGIDPHLWRAGNVNALIAYYKLGIEASGKLELERSKAGFMSRLANLRELQDDLEEAQHLIREVVDIKRLHGDKDGLLATALYTLSAIQRKQREFHAARETAKAALKIAEEIGSKRHIIRNRCQLAAIDIEVGNIESAESHLKQALGVRQTLESHEQDTWISSTLYRLLGQVSFLKQDYALARQYYQRSLEIAQQVNIPTMEARAKGCIAELELTLGNLDQAQVTQQEAIDLYTKLGMKRELEKTKDLLEQIMSRKKS